MAAYQRLWPAASGGVLALDHDYATPQEEAADWAVWLDKFDRDIWPVFQRRGYSKDAAMMTYFRMYPYTPVDDDD